MIYQGKFLNDYPVFLNPMLKRYIFIFIFSLTLFFLHNNLLAQNNDNQFDKIVIDAGHGGIDSGALGSVSKEKDIVLSLALKIGVLIEMNLKDVKVIYTREDDRLVPLHERATIANESHADLFISIHCNSNVNSKYFGSETYVMGIHKSDENLNVAKTENAAILMEDDYAETYDGFDPDSDEDYIMLNMFQSSTLDQSIQFSMMLQDKLEHTAGMYNRGVKQAGFVVLYLTTMPGVLIETGFISNPAEEKYLLDQENQDKIAHAVFDAILEYKHYHDKHSSAEVDQENK